MQEIIDLHKESLKNNLDEISKILKERGVRNESVLDSCNEILSLSCENIVKKWKNGKKYLRTSFVKEAFSNSYPENIIKTSIYIDTIINILDDLLDEKMDDNNKKLYVLEFLRVFSLYNYEYPTKEFQACLGKYFNKLISLAVTEDCYKNLIDRENNLDMVVKHSIEVLDCRSMDIDIFIELVILNDSLYDDKNDNIIKIGRMFRAINIMKKDILDIEHDNKTGQESMVSKVSKRNDLDLSKYILSITDYYLNEAKKILSKKSLDGYAVPVNNFYGMIERDRDEIINILTK